MPINSSPSDAVHSRRDRVLADVKQIVAEHATIPAEDIREDHHLFDDLGYDSLDVVETAMEIEEQFDVPVPDDLSDRVRTVRDVADGVLQLLEQPGQTGEL